MNETSSYHIARIKKADEEWSDREAESATVLLLSEDPNYVPSWGRTRTCPPFSLTLNTCSWGLNVILLLGIITYYSGMFRESTSCLCPGGSVCEFEHAFHDAMLTLSQSVLTWGNSAG